MFMTRSFRTLAAAAALALVAGGAQAATVSCPGTAVTTDREFSLTTTPGATCFATGNGNINGNPNPGQDPLFPLLSTAFGAGHVLIDKSDDAVSGVKPDALSATAGSLVAGLSGSFSFLLPAAPAGKIWTNIVLAFKSGGGQLDPDWAAFLLPDGVTSGDWAISGKQALSHANLYGQLKDAPPPPPIPLPAAGWLMVAGLGGLAALRRRRRA